jgi:hypothetical protein
MEKTGQVEGFQARQLTVVGGDQEIHHGALVAAGKRDGQRVVAADVARLARSEGDVVVLRDAELGANHDLDAAIEQGGGGVLLRGWGRAALRLAAGCEAKCEQASQ